MCLISKCPKKKPIHKQRCTKTKYDIIFLKFTETLQLGYFLRRLSEWTGWPHTSSYADATAQKDSKGACRVSFTKANALVCDFQAKWLTRTDFTTSPSSPVTLGLLIFAHKQTSPILKPSFFLRKPLWPVSVFADTRHYICRRSSKSSHGEFPETFRPTLSPVYPLLLAKSPLSLQNMEVD